MANPTNATQHPGSPAEGVHSIACGGCGAALPIKLDASTIRCPYCGVEHRVSDAERERMRSTAEELRKTDALSNAAEEIRTRLLKPTVAVLFADPWNSFMLIMWILLGWALGSAVGEIVHRPPIFERGNAYISSSLVLYLPIIAFCFAVFAVWKSFSLRALRTAAAALPPIAGSAALRCRNCGSDLGEGTDARAFVVCSYCRTQNLIGLTEVRRREQLTRAQGEKKLGVLRTTETKLGNRLIMLVASLVVMPIALGAALNPLENLVLVALFPMLPAPAKPAPWTELPANLAVEKPADPRKPWPIVWVQDRHVAPTVTVRHQGKSRVTDAKRLHQLPLRMGLRVVDRKRKGRGMGIIADTSQLLFPGSGVYDDADDIVSRIEPQRWTQLAVLPQWGDADDYDAYFDWLGPSPEPADSIKLIVTDASEFRGGGIIWPSTVGLSSARTEAEADNADQIVGVPDVYPAHESSAKAWKPRAPDGSKGWIVVRFDKVVVAKGVAVVETFQPGAVIRIEDMSNDAWPDPLWIGTVEPGDASRVMVLPLAEVRRITALRIVVDNSRIKGRTEIDGVGLVLPTR